MKKEAIGSKPCWYAIQTKPRQDERAVSNLNVCRVETFAPKILDRQYCQYTDRAKSLIKPLFPSYVFARFIPEEMLHKVKFMRGVHKILSTGGLPTPVDDEIIQIIRSRQGADGLISIGEPLHPGDKVVVREGPLRDFIGIFEGNSNDQKRVSILLSTVSYQTHFVVAREAVKRVGEHVHS